MAGIPAAPRALPVLQNPLFYQTSGAFLIAWETNKQKKNIKKILTHKPNTHRCFHIHYLVHHFLESILKPIGNKKYHIGSDFLPNNHIFLSGHFHQ